MSLRLSDLHEIYRSVDPAEARLIANLGAEVYVAARDRLREAWSAEMSAEEGAKADVWRAEGRVAALEEVKGRLTAAEDAVVRAATAEGTVSALRSAMETEVTRRVGESLAGFRKDYDLEKMKEMTALREQIAAAKPTEELLAVLREKVTTLEAARDTLQAQLMDHMTANTKSSHAIGKAGEATVWEMIEGVVLSEFTYAEAKNMSGVSHAADFHLWVDGPKGRRLKILIDSKKYKRAVNSDEIAKLTADVDADEDAHAGLMVSLTSPIFTRKQFQIRASGKGKPILYMSFYDIATEYHANMLCWAVRALISAIHDTPEEVNMDVERIEDLLTDINTSLKDVDGMVKTHQKMIDMLRSMKHGILQKISEFRGDVDDTISQTPEGGCVTVLKSTGARCGKPVFNGGAKCRHHTSRKERDSQVTES